MSESATPGGEPRTDPCHALVFSGIFDAEGHRCGKPEEDEAHDPLGSVNGRHPYDYRWEA